MFKVWMTDDNLSYATNALKFTALEEVQKHAQDLFSRWLGARAWAVLPQYCPTTGEEFKGFLSPETIEDNHIRKV